ncbi:ribosomal protein S18 acetylase RimI-like enzyme [Actinokineospora baliensis]|uniref:GNAT family N-acetyltransferase n=1 Tax=Actinokineospora baliensis TaxID=547056 RepID=UPI0027DDC03B|nr:GNAT family N-acetyltransferase [Actinokineospora baliensis]MBM7772985.1 ribosomal protein S18 acetylase RimI-like enzyme [Actinokineospora baliensis]
MSADESVLDNVVWASLTGAHAHLAVRHGDAARYPEDVAPFLGAADEPGPQIWSDIAAAAGPGAQVVVSPGLPRPEEAWDTTFDLAGVQLVDDHLEPEVDVEAIRLTHADVPEMIELVERTQPGPFLPRTILLGDYFGFRREGALVAMAGERMHPPGWTEISAVCTDPAYRGQGLATRLVLTVAAGIRARGDVPFLHTGAANTNAIRLYEALGFRLRRHVRFTGVQVPATQPA